MNRPLTSPTNEVYSSLIYRVAAEHTSEHMLYLLDIDPREGQDFESTVQRRQCSELSEYTHGNSYSYASYTVIL